MDCRVKPGNDGMLGRPGLVATAAAAAVTAATITAAAIIVVRRRCGVLLWRRGRADADDLGLAFDHFKDLRAWRELADIDLGEVTESGERLARPAAQSPSMAPRSQPTRFSSVCTAMTTSSGLSPGVGGGGGYGGGGY